MMQANNLPKLDSSKNWVIRMLIILSLTLAVISPVQAKQHKHAAKHHQHLHAVHYKPGTIDHLAGYIKHKYKRPADSAKTIANAITKASHKFKLDKYVIAAVIARESSFKPWSSNGGNLGLMQVAVAVHQKEIRSVGGDITSSAPNIMVGARLLRECLDTNAKGNLHAAVSLYNKGCSKIGLEQKLSDGDSYARWVLSEAEAARKWSPRSKSFS